MKPCSPHASVPTVDFASFTLFYLLTHLLCIHSRVYMCAHTHTRDEEREETNGMGGCKYGFYGMLSGQ